MNNLLQEFMNNIVEGDLVGKEEFPDIETLENDLIYNEFSLQHALGSFLKKRLGNEYRIEYERHAGKHFDINTEYKHEIDVVVYNAENRKCAIELKYPRNGQYPEQMFSFVKDIAFLEELRRKGNNPFQSAYAIVLVDDEKFYHMPSKGSGKKWVYKHFRGVTLPLNAGEIYQKPTGDSFESVELSLHNDYRIEWIGSKNKLRYYIVEIK